MPKRTWEVGDEIVAFTPDDFFASCRIIAIDDHPLEYAQIQVEPIDAVALPVPRWWVSERDCRPK